VGCLFFDDWLCRYGCDHCPFCAPVWIYCLCMGYVYKQFADDDAFLVCRTEEISCSIRLAFGITLWNINRRILCSRYVHYYRINRLTPHLPHSPVNLFPRLYGSLDASERIGCVSEEKTNEFVLFFSQLALPLHINYAGYGKYK